MIIVKSLFQEKLSTASRFIFTKISNASSLQGGMLKFSKNKIEIITTNLSDFFYTSLKVETDLEKTIIVDIKKIVEFLSFLPSGKVILELAEKTLSLSLGKSIGSFNLISAKDFPEPPLIEGNQHSVKKVFFEKIIPLVLFAASNDEMRPVLTGIKFSSKNSQRYIAATDGFRLSLIIEKNTENLPDIILSAHILSEIVHLKTKQSEIVITFSEKEKIVVFKIGDDMIYSRLIEGDFPPFEKVIPSSHEIRVVLNREEMIKNIKSAAVFARELSNIVVFEIKKDGLYLKPRSKDNQGTIIYQDALVEGEEGRIAFNYKFVLDFLLAAKTEKIIFEMTQSSAPAVFKIDKNEDFIHIIMPVRTDDELSND